MFFMTPGLSKDIRRHERHRPKDASHQIRHMVLTYSSAMDSQSGVCRWPCQSSLVVVVWVCKINTEELLRSKNVFSIMHSELISLE